MSRGFDIIRTCFYLPRVSMQWMRREVLTAWPGKAHFLLLAMAGRVSVDPRPYH
jgi:hypothetical protein